MKMFEVGGCVRDSILGIRSKDIDFSVEADSFDAMREELQELGFEIFLETPEFLTIRARFPKGQTPFEKHKGLTADFVLCRRDGAYSDGRRPDQVIPGKLFDDLKRRDFTMNAIARTMDGVLMDPFNGISDIRLRTIRAVGSAEDRFREDALRALRALRFAVTKGFQLDQEVIEALRSDWLPPLLSSVSKERKREELHKMFHHDTVLSMNLLYAMKVSLREVIFCDGLWLEPSLKQ